MIEVLGIIASILVAASFFMNGEKFIRAVNIIGSAVFIIYGMLIGSVSVALLNSISIAVNAFKIYNIKRRNNNEKDDHSHQ